MPQMLENIDADVPLHWHSAKGNVVCLQQGNNFEKYAYLPRVTSEKWTNLCSECNRVDIRCCVTGSLNTRNDNDEFVNLSFSKQQSIAWTQIAQIRGIFSVART